MGDREEVGLCTRGAFVTSNLAIPGQSEDLREVGIIPPILHVYTHIYSTILAHPEVYV